MSSSVKDMTWCLISCTWHISIQGIEESNECVRTLKPVSFYSDSRGDLMGVISPLATLLVVAMP